MEINRQVVGDKKVISIAGELDMGNVKELKAVFDEEVASGTRYIVIDMATLNYIDSSGIGAFIALMNKLRSLNGSVTLMKIQPEVMRIFQMTKLTAFFKIINDLSELGSSGSSSGGSASSGIQPL